MRRKSIRMNLKACCLAALLFNSSVALAELRLPEGVYPYAVVEQDLPVALREFGQNVGVRVDVSTKVKGVLKGKLPKLTAKEFLDYISQAYRLDWYFDGTSLYFSSSSEAERRFFGLGRITLPDLKQRLRDLDYFDDRYPITMAMEGKYVTLTAPPRYLSIVEWTIANFARPNAKPVTEAAAKTTVYRASQVSVQKFGADGKASE